MSLIADRGRQKRLIIAGSDCWRKSWLKAALLSRASWFYGSIPVIATCMESNVSVENRTQIEPERGANVSLGDSQLLETFWSSNNFWQISPKKWLTATLLPLLIHIYCSQFPAICFQAFTAIGLSPTLLFHYSEHRLVLAGHIWWFSEVRLANYELEFFISVIFQGTFVI